MTYEANVSCLVVNKCVIIAENYLKYRSFCWASRLKHNGIACAQLYAGAKPG